jgi:hypothetical protein
MSIPGNIAQTKSYTCNNMGRITVRVPCQGAGTYTLKLEHPISNPSNVVAYAGKNEMYTSGGQGQYVSIESFFSCGVFLLVPRHTLDVEESNSY